MKPLRSVNAAAAVLNALAIAAALLGAQRVAALAIAASIFLLIRSLERLRSAIVRNTRP